MEETNYHARLDDDESAMNYSARFQTRRITQVNCTRSRVHTYLNALINRQKIARNSSVPTQLHFIPIFFQMQKTSIRIILNLKKNIQKSKNKKKKENKVGKIEIEFETNVILINQMNHPKT